MPQVFQFPAAPNRLWRQYENDLIEQAFPAMEVREDEQAELLDRLKVHWSWIHGPLSFAINLQAPASCSEMEWRLVEEQVRKFAEEIVNARAETLRAALVQFAKVELSLMRAMSGEPPPFDRLAAKPEDLPD